MYSVIYIVDMSPNCNKTIKMSTNNIYHNQFNGKQNCCLSK